MNLQRMIEQAKREAKASPAKAAVLAILLIVAVYNWAPMVYGWVVPDSSKKGGAKSTAVVAKANSSDGASINQKISGNESSGAKKPIDSSQADWKQLAQWIDTDPLMEPADWPEGVVCPFRGEEKSSQNRGIDDVASDLPDESQISMADLPTPESIGLNVSSFIIGPNGRMIRLGDSIIHEGEEVRIFESGTIMSERDVASSEGVDTNGSSVFEISQITPQYVEFKGDAETYRVNISGREKPTWFRRALRNEDAG